MPTEPHRVLRVDYNGLARELRSPVKVVDPISGRSSDFDKGIWDTGATNTAIDRRVAIALGLTPTGVTQVATANGVALSNTYVINLFVHHSQVMFQQVIVSDGDLGAATDVLIGMDIIACGDFIVQNNNGRTSFEYAIPPFDTKQNWIERANSQNARFQKRQAKGRPR